MTPPQDLKKGSNAPDNAKSQFTLDDTRPKNIEEIMTREIITIAPESSLYEAARIMGQRRIGSLVVFKYNTPVGIITERDLLKVVSRGVDLEKDWKSGIISIKDVKVEKAMTCPITMVCLDSSIKTAAQIMIEKKIGRLPVCDSGNIAGIITASDLIKSLPEVPETMKEWAEIDYFMTKQVITTDRETLVDDAAKIMASKQIGSVIITKKGKPIGIFTERDLLTKFLATDKSLKTQVGKACSSPLITAPLGINVHDAARIMASRHVRRLPIMKDNELVGILSAHDLVEAYARG